MPKPDKQGLKIVVTEDRYDMYGTPGSKRDAFYASYIKAMGGINHTVPPGNYAFKVYRKGLALMTSLEPWISE